MGLVFWEKINIFCTLIGTRTPGRPARSLATVQTALPGSQKVYDTILIKSLSYFFVDNFIVPSVALSTSPNEYSALTDKLDRTWNS
jgi:hypothetical protein